MSEVRRLSEVYKPFQTEVNLLKEGSLKKVI